MVNIYNSGGEEGLRIATEQEIDEMLADVFRKD